MVPVWSGCGVGTSADETPTAILFQERPPGFLYRESGYRPRRRSVDVWRRAQLEARSARLLSGRGIAIRDFDFIHMKASPRGKSVPPPIDRPRSHKSMTDETSSTPLKQAEQLPLQISAASMQTSYSNFVRGVMTEEEVMLDFGLNPNVAGKVVDEPAVLTNRIIISIPSAVRLHQLLQSMLIRRQQAAEASRKASSGPVESAAAGP